VPLKRLSPWWKRTLKNRPVSTGKKTLAAGNHPGGQ